jgi:heme O synthase-like polyprenyltransferase
VYGVGSLLLGAWMLWLCSQFLMRSERTLWARKLFFFTLIYLPLVFGLLVLDVNYL